MRPGHRNLITDVPGLLVGNADDALLRSGVTVLSAETPFTGGVHVMGGAPGTRETDALAPDRLGPPVDAFVLSGGSALGLAAASGVADALRTAGRGFEVRGQHVPIVPAAILFDLANGGAKDWDENPYPGLGRAALAAAGPDFALGSHGAGAGATTAGLKGGLGSASLVLEDGTTVAALVAVNAMGSALAEGGPHFLAAPFEIDGEFGGCGPAPAPDLSGPLPLKGAAQGEATTIAIVATDAALTRAEAHRVAVTAHDGMARALWPAHTLMDGDLVFAAATGLRPLEDSVLGPLRIGQAAAHCLARAIARGVHAATPAEGDLLPTWSQRFGS